MKVISNAFIFEDLPPMTLAEFFLEFSSPWRLQRNHFLEAACATCLGASCIAPYGINDSRHDETNPKNNFKYETSLHNCLWRSNRAAIWTDELTHLFPFLECLTTAFTGLRPAYARKTENPPAATPVQRFVRPFSLAHLTSQLITPVPAVYTIARYLVKKEPAMMLHVRLRLICWITPGNGTTALGELFWLPPGRWLVSRFPVLRRMYVWCPLHRRRDRGIGSQLNHQCFKVAF